MHHNRPIVRKLRLPMTSQFHQQFIRPLTANVSDGNVINRLQEETSDFSALSASALASLAPEILKPTAQATSLAYIDNGWQEKRFRFYMEVEIDRTQYSTRYAMITGFTSHADISHGGNIDPGMKLYLNSIIVYTDNRSANHLTGAHGINRVMQTNTQVIQPIATPDMTSYSNRLRAHDVVSNMAALDLTQDVGYAVNTVGSQMHVAQASRDRLLPSVYLSNVLGGNIVASRTLDDSSNMLNSGFDSYYKEFIGSVKDPGFTSNAFTGLLMTKTSYGLTGFITWQELVNLFPEVMGDQVTTVEIPKTGLINYSTHTEHLRGFGIENQALAIVQNMLPSIMTMFMIQHASFVLTNETMTGQPNIVIQAITPMSDKIDARALITAFQTQVIQQMAPAISNGNMMQFSMTVSCNVLTEMVMKIRFNGSQDIEFAVPLFADSTFTAFGYATRKDLDSLTHELSALTEAVAYTLDPNGHGTGVEPQAIARNNQAFNDFITDPLQDNIGSGFVLNPPPRMPAAPQQSYPGYLDNTDPLALNRS